MPYNRHETLQDLESIIILVILMTVMEVTMMVVVLIVDKTINYDYSNFTMCKNTEKNCFNLLNYINVESGSESLILERYGDMLNKKTTAPKINDDNLSTNVENLTVVLPNYDVANIKNPKYSDFVLNYGCQFVTYRYYVKDDELENYEHFFDDNGYAFVSIADAIKYYKKIYGNE